ncbi:MAG TPA: DUF541 domain-containing protein [Campylobacterales bacterium]|nr:DUF541 domain-containing protein [Campylobacterales bacterium]HIP58934.1 DUF541 domain-containing protein [Campylobacterales bacterium]
MKIATLITLSSVSLFGLSINFSKSFDAEIKPDTLQAGINITVKKASEKEVVQSLSMFSTFIDKDKDVEKKWGNYSVHPQYKYENNHRYKSDYVGNMQYQISSKDSDKLNNFLVALYSQKNDNRVDISTSSVSWVMSESQKSGKIDALRLEAIIWADSYANSLSDSLSKKCTVKSLSFIPVNHYYPQPMMRMESKNMDAVSAPTPTQDLQKMSVTPTIQLECK